MNTLLRIVNENFKNYRDELDKNIKSKEKLEQLVEKRSKQLLEREKLVKVKLYLGMKRNHNITIASIWIYVLYAIMWRRKLITLNIRKMRIQMDL